LTVSVGVSGNGVKESELPDTGFDRPRGKRTLVVRAGIGSGKGQVGITTEEPARGPASFGVDDRGRVYILDSVNSRVSRYRDGTFDAEFELPDDGFEDIAVARDTIAVLARSGNRRVVLIDQERGVVATMPIAPSVPEIFRIAIVDDDVLVGCPSVRTIAFHRIGSLDGVAAGETSQAKPRYDGVPLPSRHTLKAVRLGEHDISAEVLGNGGVRALRLRAHSKRKVASIVDATGDRDGNLVIVWGVYRDLPDGSTDRARLVVARYTPAGELLGTAEAENDSDPEPLRKIALSESGEVYQLDNEPGSCSIYHMALEP
jgi:hypothetical protein